MSQRIPYIRICEKANASSQSLISLKYQLYENKNEKKSDTNESINSETTYTIGMTTGDKILSL